MLSPYLFVGTTVRDLRRAYSPIDYLIACHTTLYSRILVMLYYFIREYINVYGRPPVRRDMGQAYSPIDYLIACHTAL